MTDEYEMAGRRIGDIASTAGLTVRTLHHYEQIGLLVASERTPAGHRLYSPDDVQRLYRICLLREIGLSLDDIRQSLDDEGYQLQNALRLHLETLAQQTTNVGRLTTRVKALLDSSTHDATTSSEDLLQILSEMPSGKASVQQRVSILVYKDLEAAHDYLVRVFGLMSGEISRDGSGRVVHTELHAGDGVIWLHPETLEFALQSPKSLGAATATTAIMVADVDEHFQQAKQQGATIVYEPIDQPYGYRDYSARDCEGGLWSFMKALD